MFFPMLRPFPPPWKTVRYMPYDYSPELLLAAIAIVVGIAAFVHGVIGIGFPLITTPCIALLTDLKTAVLVTVLPNILLNVLSILRGGNWRDNLAEHWRLAAYVFVGSLVGTQFLIGLPAEPLKLALALMMLVSLNLNRLKTWDWSFLTTRRRTSEAAFGLAAGVLSGTVNVSVPPLAIYFLGLALSPTATVQLFNVCFIVGKLTQAGTLAAHGEFTAAILWQSAGLTVLAGICLIPGMRIQSRLETATYRRWLNATLALMAALMLVQVGLVWWR